MAPFPLAVVGVNENPPAQTISHGVAPLGGLLPQGRDCAARRHRAIDVDQGCMTPPFPFNRSEGP
jgi:hypothetical protein